MKRLNLPRATRADMGTIVGGLSVAFGAATQWGAGIGLMVGGTLAAVFSLFVYDVDDR